MLHCLFAESSWKYMEKKMHEDLRGACEKEFHNLFKRQMYFLKWISIWMCEWRQLALSIISMALELNFILFGLYQIIVHSMMLMQVFTCYFLLACILWFFSKIFYAFQNIMYRIFNWLSKIAHRSLPWKPFQIGAGILPCGDIDGGGTHWSRDFPVRDSHPWVN